MNGTIVLIPARSGSTRVKNKNLRSLGGRPLLAHAVESAVNSGVGRVIVSTDSDDIAAVARDWGAESPFRRPADLAGAAATSFSVIAHALDWCVENEGRLPERIVFRPPTVPFITSDTLAEMVQALSASQGANSIGTVYEPSTHPFTIVREAADGFLEAGFIDIDGETIDTIERSQDYPRVWAGSPGCRITRTAFYDELRRRAGAANFLDIQHTSTYDTARCLPYVIDRFEAADIDDEFDFFLAEQIHRHRTRTEMTSS